MNSMREIVDKLDSMDIREKLAEIDKLSDFEQQGYEAAASIAQVAGISPEELLIGTVANGEPNGQLANIQRTLGVIRWCLDQRRNG